jgi:N-hydroxyarylamine O-acetyltransferase
MPRMLDIDAYLRRIDHERPGAPTAEALKALQRAHLLAVPFENLDIHLGRRLSLAEGALFDKIVLRRRGGFCYELNGLFAALLRALGFNVTMIAARVARQGGGFGPDRDHLALLVRARASGEPGNTADTADTAAPLGPPFLVDVGFGDSFVTPLRLDDAGEQAQGDQVYRITEEEGFARLLSRRGATGGAEPQYLFTLDPREHVDFEEMCLYHQTSPDSPFPKKRVCTRATPRGRITLSEGLLITTEFGERRERPVETEEERAAVLRESFGIELAPEA